MTKTECQNIVAKAIETLNRELDGSGYVFSRGGASYGSDGCSFKVEATEQGGNSKREQDFITLAKRWGLDKSDLGKTYTDRRGNTMKIVGANPRAKRYPILCEEIGSAKTWKVDLFTIQAALGK